MSSSSASAVGVVLRPPAPASEQRSLPWCGGNGRSAGRKPVPMPYPGLCDHRTRQVGAGPFSILRRLPASLMVPPATAPALERWHLLTMRIFPPDGGHGRDPAWIGRSRSGHESVPALCPTQPPARTSAMVVTVVGGAKPRRAARAGTRCPLTGERVTRSMAEKRAGREQELGRQSARTSGDRCGFPAAPDILALGDDQRGQLGRRRQFPVSILTFQLVDAGQRAGSAATSDAPTACRRRPRPVVRPAQRAPQRACHGRRPVPRHPAGRRAAAR
jgi:hypothetical protein